MRRGIRFIDGREFYLAGRGTKESMRSEAEVLRGSWLQVRILPYGWGGGGSLVDDYGVWVHGRKPERARRGEG